MSSSFPSADFTGKFTFEIPPRSPQTSPSTFTLPYNPHQLSTAATEFTANFASSAQQSDLAKLEETNLESFISPVKDEATLGGGLSEVAWNSDALFGSRSSSQDLMQIIFDEDPSASNLNIRLDDDIFIEANKESAVHVFGVSPIRSFLTNLARKDVASSRTSSSGQCCNVPLER
jgi:hypothetical protein